MAADPPTSRIAEIVSQFRQYDQGVQDLLEGCLPVQEDMKKVPVIFASPDRAFSSMQEILGIEATKNVPLPFVSVLRSRVRPDPLRFHGTNVFFRKLATTVDGTSTVSVPFPLPYDITYQIEYWAKNRETLNVLELWSATQFDGGFEMFIPIDFSQTPPWSGTKNIPFENEGISDNSNLEPGTEHRTLRFTQQLTAKGWLVATSRTEITKAVHKIYSDFYLAATGADFGAVTAADVAGDPLTYDQFMRLTTNVDGSSTITNY